MIPLFSAVFAGIGSLIETCRDIRRADVTDWNTKVQDAGDRAEAEVRKLVQYLNDEVVPDVRKHSSTALRVASEKLAELAKTLEDRT